MSSIWQTKAASCSGGIHHSFFCHGLSSFFLMSVEWSHVTPSRPSLTPPFYQQACVRSIAHVPQELDYKTGRSNALLHLQSFCGGGHWSLCCDTKRLQSLLRQNVSWQ